MKKMNINQIRFFISLCVVCVITVLFIASPYVEESVFDEVLPIENIEIKGGFVNISPRVLQQLVADNLNGGFFSVDIHQIRNALRDMPWVEDVSVRRIWPAGLEISVTEKVAVAYWGKAALISDRGEVFEPQSVDESLILPRLYGPEGLHESVWFFAKETDSKIAAMSLELSALKLDARRAWEIRLSNGVIVRLGREDTETRLSRFVQVFSMKDAPELTQFSVVDLRYPNGFAVDKKRSSSTNKINSSVSEV